MNEQELMNKLRASKAIMDSPKLNSGKSSMSGGLPPTSLQQFDMPHAKYNIPDEFLSESKAPSVSQFNSQPRENTKPVGVPSVDAIKKSKLPDEIKRLMIEHPISQPNQPQMTISDDLIEKASRLMKRTDSNYVPESAKTKEKVPTQNIDYNSLQEMINEAVNNALKKSGILVESTEKTNEMFSFRVGKHLFEGKITKVKKMS